MRAIDADKLRQDVLDWEDCPNGFSDTYDKARIIDEINYQPTLDVEPVRHGHWEFIGGYGYQYRCSNCIRCAEHRTNYCPSCGAKMDEAEK